MWQTIKSLSTLIIITLFIISLGLLAAVSFYWLILYGPTAGGDFGGVLCVFLIILFLALTGLFGTLLFAIKRGTENQSK